MREFHYSYREGKGPFNFMVCAGRITGFYIYLFGKRFYHFWGRKV